MESGLKRRILTLNEKARLHGDESQHEQTDAWSNRDLIPLPPQRRTWGTCCVDSALLATGLFRASTQKLTR